MGRLRLRSKSLVFFFLLLISLSIFAYFESNCSRIVRYGRYSFEDSVDWGGGDVIPFNYFLVDNENNEFVGFFVNEYIAYGDYLYFSEVDGMGIEYYCFYESKLYLSRIDLNNNKMERFINEKESAETYLIYLKINEMSDYDISWLNNNRNKCS